MNSFLFSLHTVQEFSVPQTGTMPWHNRFKHEQELMVPMGETSCTVFNLMLWALCSHGYHSSLLPLWGVCARASEKEHSVKYQSQRMLTRVKANTHTGTYTCAHKRTRTPKLPGFIWPNPDFWFMLIFWSFLAPVKHLMNPHTHTPCNIKPVSTSQSAFLWLPDSQSINHSLLHPLLPQRGLSRGKSLKVTANFPPRHLPPLTHSFPPPVSSQA